MIGYKPSYQYSGLYDNLKRDPYRSATIGKVFKDTLDTLKRQSGSEESSGKWALSCAAGMPG
jgi:hypothetical protein